MNWTRSCDSKCIYVSNVTFISFVKYICFCYSCNFFITILFANFSRTFLSFCSPYFLDNHLFCTFLVSCLQKIYRICPKIHFISHLTNRIYELSLHAYQFGVQIFPFMITNILKLITYKAYDTVAATRAKLVQLYSYLGICSPYRYLITFIWPNRTKTFGIPFQSWQCRAKFSNQIAFKTKSKPI